MHLHTHYIENNLTVLDCNVKHITLKYIEVTFTEYHIKQFNLTANVPVANINEYYIRIIISSIKFIEHFNFFS